MADENNDETLEESFLRQRKELERGTLLAISTSCPHNLLGWDANLRQQPWSKWKRVRVDSGTGRVVALDMAGVRLRGSLTNIMKKLQVFKSDLLELNLGVNALTGTIPSSLAQFRRLQQLTLHDNLLTGRIPEELQRLHHLSLVFLGGNHFNNPAHVINGFTESWKTSDEAKDHRDLYCRSRDQVEALWEDLFTESSQAEQAEVEMEAARKEAAETAAKEAAAREAAEEGLLMPAIERSQRLALAEFADTNNVRKWDDVRDLPLTRWSDTRINSAGYLVKLVLSPKAVTGEPGRYSQPMSGSLRTLVRSLLVFKTTLRMLDLSENNLSGKLPLELGEFMQLEFLYLNDNRLNSGIPSELKKLTKLQVLWLGGNDFSFADDLLLEASAISSELHSIGLNSWGGSANGGGTTRGLFFNDHKNTQLFLCSL